MNESIGGVVLGILGLVGLSYVAVKIRQNQRRLHRLVAIIDSRHSSEMQYLFEMADSGELVMYRPQSGK